MTTAAAVTGSAGPRRWTAEAGCPGPSRRCRARSDGEPVGKSVKPGAGWVWGPSAGGDGGARGRSARGEAGASSPARWEAAGTGVAPALPPPGSCGPRGPGLWTDAVLAGETRATPAGRAPSGGPAGGSAAGRTGGGSGGGELGPLPGPLPAQPGRARRLCWPRAPRRAIRWRWLDPPPLVASPPGGELLSAAGPEKSGEALGGGLTGRNPLCERLCHRDPGDERGEGGALRPRWTRREGIHSVAEITCASRTAQGFT